MFFSKIAPLAALLGAVVAVPKPQTKEEAKELIRRQYPVLECSHLTGGIHVIGAGGANSPDPKSWGYLLATAEAILEAIPGSTNVSLPYDKVFATTNPATLQPGAIANGMTTLVNYIEHYHESCPNTKIGLIGYSSGAIIIMNVLCQDGISFASSYSDVIIGTTTFGDETRAAGQPWDLGTCTSYSGTAPRSDNSACYPYASNLQSYCDLEDPDCCAGSGDDLSVHYEYPQKYDSAIASFFQQKFQASQ